MKKFILGFAVLVFSTNLFATPEFAREQQADCSVCHTNIPALSETGQSFLRNGFRFSSSDETTLKKTLAGKTVPLAVMLRETYSSLTKDDSQKVKLYTGGSITKNLSFFALTQEVFGTGDNSNSPSSFEQKASRAYFQLNLKDDKHVIRVGLMSPYTQFGNLQKIYADSGLQGGDGENKEDDQKGKYGRSLTRSNGNGNGNGNGNNGQGNNNTQGNGNGNGQGNGNSQEHGNHGNNNYKTPLQQSSFSKYKGIEYSYLLNSKWMFLVSYGTPVEDDNSQNSNANNNTKKNTEKSTDDDYQFISGIRYSADNGLKIGLLYNSFQKKGEDSYSVIIPIEKSFDKFLLSSAIVYKSNDTQDDYKGIENALVYNINDTSHIRAIVNMDKDENAQYNYGYSLSYSKIFKNKLMFRITATKKDTDTQNDDYIKASISLFL